MFYSPLRYPGGKGRISPWFVSLIRSNSLSGGTYIEPYAGGAGVALYLLIRGYVNNIYINDLDQNVYDFWHQVLNNTEELVEWIENVPVNVSTWEYSKGILFSGNRTNRLECAKAFFFLNRVNRSGIITGGLIGGIHQKGKYKMDARFNRTELISRILRISSFRKRIKLSNLDAIELIRNLNSLEDERGLIYLDPPYYKEGGGLYLNAYTDDGHSAISESLQKLNTPWVLTYDNHPKIRQLYKWANSSSLPVRYIAQRRRVETELLYYGNLRLN